MHGFRLEQGLIKALSCDVIHDFDPTHFSRNDAGLKVLETKTILPRLTLTTNVDDDLRGAIDAACTFPESGLPTVNIQFTLRWRDASKVERFARLARERGGKHIYIIVSPGRDSEEFYFFIAGRIIRDRLYELARDENPNAIWILYINSDYQNALNRRPEIFIRNLREWLGKKRQSRTRKAGHIISVRSGEGMVIFDASGENSLVFAFTDIDDDELRQVCSNVCHLRRDDLIKGLRVSFEVVEADGDYRAISLLAMENLRPIRTRLRELSD